MKNKIAPWLAFFRLPNLPTAPGDAIAGAAICLTLSQPFGAGSTVPIQLLAAGAAALLIYMFGLADNDIVGAEEDQQHAPHRPIPSGGITVSQAETARVTCLILAVAGSALCNMPIAWWCVTAVLVSGVMLYNRHKNKWPLFGLLAMGLCRGLSLFAGAAAMWSVAPGTLFSTPVLVAVVGWTAYICAVTWLAAKEHVAGAPMSWGRFLPGLAVFIPMTALALYPRWSWTLISVCSLCAYGIWFLSVLPLGKPHDPDKRRKAVGGAIGAILYMQAGFILSFPHVVMVAIVLALFTSNVFIRKFLDNVQGS